MGLVHPQKDGKQHINFVVCAGPDCFRAKSVSGVRIVFGPDDPKCFEGFFLHLNDILIHVLWRIPRFGLVHPQEDG